MLNFPHYEKVIQNTLLVTLLRSGSTTGLVLAVQNAKEKYSIPCVSICATQNSDMSGLADLNLEIPCAFDESVCQTRTVSNFYAANLHSIKLLSCA